MHTHTHTHIAVLGGNDADWSPLSSDSFASGQGVMSLGQFSGGFSFPKGQMGFSWNNMRALPCAELHFPLVAVQSELWRTEAR